MPAFAVLAPLLIVSAALQVPTAGSPRVSYHATASLDETARTLRGSVTIRVRRSSGHTTSPLALDPGASVISALRLDGTPTAVAGPGDRPTLALRPAATPADSLVVLELEFVAREAGTARSRDAADRAFTFRAWLPRIVASGAWARSIPADYLVTLDVPADQVLGASGTPLCGDAGWAGARRPAGAPVTLRRPGSPAPRDSAAAAVAPGDCGPGAPGRKTVVWYAEEVPDFALTLDPGFRYEEGDFLERPVRVLYRPGAERTWGAGVAVRRSESALAWLQEAFGWLRQHPELRLQPYPWPQTTTVQGLDTDGAADPMVATAPSPDQAAILYQLARIYLASATAVAPTDDAWLDRGLAQYLVDTYLESQGRGGAYRRLERTLIEDELDGRGRPAVRTAPGARDSADARRGTFMFHQLRWVLGDERSWDLLAAYWQRARLGTSDEALFRTVADSTAGRDLGPLLEQWLRRTAVTDYSLGAVRRTRLAAGGWRTTVEVARPAADIYPLTVEVVADSGVATAVAGGGTPRDTVVVETRTEPRRVILDPALRSHDWNALDNRRTFGLAPRRGAPAAVYLDTWFTRRSERDRLTVGWTPTAWYTDEGGWTFGLRGRSDYLGRFALNELWLSTGTGLGARGGRRDVDGRVVLRNPLWLRAPRLGEWLELGRIEGREFAGAGLEWKGDRSAASLAAGWLRTATTAYLDTARWDDATTLEVTASVRASADGRRGRSTARLTLTGGHFALRGSAATAAPGGEYLRVAGEATAQRDLRGLHLRSRAWAAAAPGLGAGPRQRRIFVAGADPYADFADPFLRSRGALLARTALPYQSPGIGGLRALDPALASAHAAGVSVEVEKDITRGDVALARRVAVALFADGGAADGDVHPARPGTMAPVADAGLGLRADQRIGATAFQTRCDFPFWVSAPSLARRGQARDARLAFRWVLSFAAAF